MRSHTERMRVAFVDTDMSGRIHYTAAMRFFERAEHSLMRAVYGELPDLEPLTRLPRVHVEADYRAMLAFDDEVLCTARVDKVGATSISYAYDLQRLGGESAVTGKIVVVSVDEAGRPSPIPDSLRAALERSAPS